MAKIAVILVNYYGMKDTDECIRSIRQSDMKADIVVVDNSCGSEEAALLQKAHLDVTVIANRENIGFAAANNAGIRWAMERDYEYVMLLNNDTVIEPDMIRFLVGKADQGTVAVPAMYYASQPDALWYGGGSISRWLGKSRHLQLRTERTVTYATGCCMMLHRDIIMNVGMLDKRYFMYCEDLEYSLRLAENHVSILYVPEAKLFHKVGKSSGGPQSPLSNYYLTRNRLHCIREHRSYFRPTAYLFSISTRYIRMIMSVFHDDRFRAFQSGISDYKRGVWGKRKCENSMRQSQAASEILEEK